MEYAPDEGRGGRSAVGKGAGIGGKTAGGRDKERWYGMGLVGKLAHGKRIEGSIHQNTLCCILPVLSKNIKISRDGLTATYINAKH